MPDWPTVYEALKTRIEDAGVAVRAERLGLETTGTFDGLTLTTNTDYDWEIRCHNVAHSFGHITQWSLDPHRFETLYADLDGAKQHEPFDPAALDAVLQRFREYEEEASQYAVWLLAAVGHAAAIAAFTEFARADIEAIIDYHRDGMAPIWHEFFDQWKQQVAAGAQTVLPFEPKPIPPFRPVQIVKKRVIREVDGIP